MHDLRNMMPDVDVLLSLTPEELAAKMIPLLQKRSATQNRGMIHGGNIANEFGNVPDWHENKYPSQKIEEAQRAFFEAWAWLESQALLIWADSSNGQSGWRRLSRKAKSFEDEGEFLAFATGKQLRPEMLHRDIAMPVWKSFSRGEFDVAIFQAMKAVEIAVQKASGCSQNLFGVKLMREAYNVEKGSLTDHTLETPEREAQLALFAGAIGWFKNPQSHRNVGVSDATEAIESIMFANYLLKTVDRRVAAKLEKSK